MENRCTELVLYGGLPVGKGPDRALSTSLVGGSSGTIDAKVERQTECEDQDDFSRLENEEKEVTGQLCELFESFGVVDSEKDGVSYPKRLEVVKSHIARLKAKLEPYSSTMYGKSELKAYLEIEGDSCGIHCPAVDGIPAFGCCGARVGWFSAVKLGLGAVCELPEEVAKKDKEFARRAFEHKDPGFSYLYPFGLQALQGFGTGGVQYVSAFGKGYCFLWLLIPSFRMRVARVLGPNALISDVLVMLRVAGAQVVSVKLSFRRSLAHVTPVKGKCIELKYLVNKLQKFVRDHPFARIGGVAKELCEVCGYMVNPENHHIRCKVQEVKKCLVCFDAVRDHAAVCRGALAGTASRRLIGDAVHALDVKLSVVRAGVAPSSLTIEAVKYISADSQKRYLLNHGYDLGAEKSSHSWGSMFEELYEGKFRTDYLAWLQTELVPYFHFTHGMGSFEVGEVVDHGFDDGLSALTPTHYGTFFDEERGLEDYGGFEHGVVVGNMNVSVYSFAAFLLGLAIGGFVVIIM